ncbi:MAG: pantetheine-phosphate adenylyltransferase [Mariprofundales bacterium]
MAAYPGTFDPITLGHVDVVQRGLKLFDSVIIGVAENVQKKPHFPLETRLQMVSSVFATESRVKVSPFCGLLVDFAKQSNSCAILRGLRAASDFEYEFQMATMNRRLNTSIETVFVMAREEYTFVSSSFIREIHNMGGDVADLLPAGILEHLQKNR